MVEEKDRIVAVFHGFFLIVERPRVFVEVVELLSVFVDVAVLSVFVEVALERVFGAVEAIGFETGSVFTDAALERVFVAVGAFSVVALTD